ncbi:putative secreted protein (Por secretion system target) [Flavobacterium sp. 90]|uniref:glycosyl hydrolase family 8 n=1 Tax=unclassified Flavobacterium TaxID=196869 RepID=UPI000EAFB1CD|nr:MULTISPECIES: glycosyl hydrolase family 8 [unclassified Flavobacterium]RKR10221.1 putative secreted protein (Por secretion system target) [Flavobacterium sp. 81]TCK54007.1 putative secreted protein (Por secretion system target) [Flavobacterium sp. 90]
MKNLLLITVAFLCLKSYSQKQPFPANVVFTNGLMATNKNSQDAQNNYDTWKTNFVEACSNGRYRIKFDDPSQTVSEGIGYGMLLAAYATDKTLFDGLWLYYKDNVNSNGVMNWKINGCSGINGANGATDAELDAAFALIVADYQWGSTGVINYKNDAKTLITAIKAHEVEANTFVLKPGDQFGGSQITNPSYFSPAYYRVFGTFTNDATFWNQVAAKSYTIINSNLTVNNAVGGLVSDWCQASGAYSSQASGYNREGKTYTYDAARTPWRIAVDYLWYGNADAKAYAKKSSDFVRLNLGGSSNIKDGYNQNGTLIGQWHNATFVGAFACAAMAGENQTHLNASYTDLNQLNEPNSYFNHTLKTLYSFLLTGNFYLPETKNLSTGDFDVEKSTVTLYPNPSNDKFTVSAPENSIVSVISAEGKIILEQKTTTENTEINLANYSSGLYLIKITNGNKSITKKVLLK